MGLLLKETIKVAKGCGFIKRGELQEIIVDTTVQEKNIEFPTDRWFVLQGSEKVGSFIQGVRD